MRHRLLGVPDMPTFEYQGLTIYYRDVRECGNSCGVPVVFVHGAGSSHAIWTLQINEFKQTRRVIALDLSGHGQSEAPPQGPDAEEASIENGYARELEALIEHLGLDRFVLVGHSMGGGVVMAYVLNRPARMPVAIALVDTSADLDLSRLAPGLLIETVETYLTLIRGEVTNEDSLAHRILVEEEEAKRARPEMVQRDLRACDRFDITDRVEEIDIPTFVIHGEDDDIIRLGVAEDLVRRLPRADIALIRDADHCPMVQQPKEFNRLLRKFLEWVDRQVSES